jgi:hypothetical protein
MAEYEMFRSQEPTLDMLVINEPVQCELEDPEAPLVQPMPAKLTDRFSRILQLSSVRTSVTVLFNYE